MLTGGGPLREGREGLEGPRKEKACSTATGPHRLRLQHSPWGHHHPRPGSACQRPCLSACEGGRALEDENPGTLSSSEVLWGGRGTHPLLLHPCSLTLKNESNTSTAPRLSPHRVIMSRGGAHGPVYGLGQIPKPRDDR